MMRVNRAVRQLTVRGSAQYCQRYASAAAAAAASLPASDRGIGILGMEYYVPSRYVSQSSLEKADGVGEGKYTIGLGQTNMAFCSDREDINSVMLNAVDRLLTSYDIDPRDVGRLEVGTESLVDKSKSTKTTLMRLFGDNTNIEGVTQINACYGGTQALLDSLSWCQSLDWDGRYAIVVCGDIAVYAPGPARPTGGAGAVAMLIGPDAPLKPVSGGRTTFCGDFYDFYKPSMGSEYPLVDGALSQVAYIQAVDSCYQGTVGKLERIDGRDYHTVRTAVNHMAFHAPYNKLVQQSLRRLVFNDAVRAAAKGESRAEFASLAQWVDPYVNAGNKEAKDAAYSATLADRNLDKALQKLQGTMYEDLTAVSDKLPKHIGNSYTASLYAGLASVVDSRGAGLVDERVGMFSYGSGSIATMFALEGSETSTGTFSLDRMQRVLDLDARLGARRAVKVDEYLESMEQRAQTYGTSSMEPLGRVEDVPKGSFYLAGVNEQFHREYRRRE